MKRYTSPRAERAARLHLQISSWWMLTEDELKSVTIIRKRNKIALTARLDRERSGLRSRTGVVTEQEYNALASGNVNGPGVGCASQVIPRLESGTRRVVTRLNALHMIDAGDQFLYKCMGDNRRPTKKNGPRNRGVNIVSFKGKATLYQERTSAALRIPGNEERLTLNDIRPVHGRAATRGKRAAWTYTGHT